MVVSEEGLQNPRSAKKCAGDWMEEKKMTEREQFIEDWMVIGMTFQPDVPEEEIRRRVLEAAEERFGLQNAEPALSVSEEGGQK